MRFKFMILGHEIRIRPEYEIKLHVTDFKGEDIIEERWEHDFNMNKRINVFAGYNGLIKYIFRDMDRALIVYRESALILLEDVMKSLLKIREKFVMRGATEEQLEMFDNKIHECFEKTLNVIRNRINDKNNNNISADKELLKVLESYKIYEYHKE